MRARDIRVARILHEDDELLTLEVYKNELRKLEVFDGDRFVTVLFVRRVEQGVEAFVPWDSDGVG